jgi:SanA protein
MWRSLLNRTYESRIFDINSADDEPVAIVFGAAVLRNGRLSSILRDRMDTALQLYDNGKVQRILVSGDISSSGFSEPEAMADYALQRGVHPNDIQIDDGGRRTYDTCYRASTLFGIERAIIVTQAFHLPRALFTCEQLGISAVGAAADQRVYRAARWYEFRETAAMLVALWDTIHLQEPSSRS